MTKTATIDQQRYLKRDSHGLLGLRRIARF